MYGDDQQYSNPVMDMADFLDRRETVREAGAQDRVVSFAASAGKFRKFERGNHNTSRNGAVIYLAARRMAALSSRSV